MPAYLWIDTPKVYLGTHVDARIQINGGVLRASAADVAQWTAAA